MANNELVYRAIREALDDDLSIASLLIDVDTAITSYLQSVDESDDVQAKEVAGRELREALPYLESFARTVKSNMTFYEARTRAAELVAFVLDWGTDPEDPEFRDEDIAVNGYDAKNRARIADDLANAKLGALDAVV